MNKYLLLQTASLSRCSVLPGGPIFIRLFLLTLLFMLSGCQAMKPVALPDENSLAPAQSALWSRLDNERTDDWLHLLNTGSEAMDWRLRLIDSATQSLDLQTFLWKGDRTGLTILRHIYEAADRGVRVRILLDDTFTATHDQAILDISLHPNIEYRIYNPFARRSGSVAVRQLLNLGDFRRVDHRMHNKLMVVDNRAAIVGGRNLADEYFGTHEEANFRDMEVLTAGKGVLSLSVKFDEYWNDDWSIPIERLNIKPPTKSAKGLEQWVVTAADRGLIEQSADREMSWIEAAKAGLAGEALVFADRPAGENPAAPDELPTQMADAIIDWMDSANREIVLVSAYLIPTRRLEQAIEQAESRGVQVRVLTNSIRSNNHLSAHSAYRNHVQRLVGHGADVHEVRVYAKDRAMYMEQPVADKHLGLHSKMMLIDDDLQKQRI
jgi:putative cardiolipin synthase